MKKSVVKPIAFFAGVLYGGLPAQAALLDLANVPLFLNTGKKANVLVILDNSNSMDEAANGAAVGSANPDSKSEIARRVVRRKSDPSEPDGLIDKYMGKINMGLMAYQQSGVQSRHLHNSPYDASYNPDNWDPNYEGDRDSIIKKYRMPNPTSPGDFIYYNVALPFYASANYQSAFCYSPTADFDNGSEDPGSGPWDRYRCFRRKVGTSDALPIWGNSASEAAAGYSNYWFTSRFYPTDSDYAQNILDFGRFLTWSWVSRTWFSNNSPGRGYLHVPIAELDSSQADLLDIKLATSQFSINGPTNPNLPLQNAGLTPIEGTLLTARDYFLGQLSRSSEGGPQPAPPESCGKNFAVLLTDGLPSTDRNGNAIADPVTALEEAAAAARRLRTDAEVETYVVGFALPYGVDPSTLDVIAEAGGTHTAFYADDPASLTSAMDAIFEDILDKTGAAASAATNSTSLVGDAEIYQARFNSGDWSGQLLARSIDSDLRISDSPLWDAGEVIKQQAPGDRVIITYGLDTNDGMPFTWSRINSQTNTAQRDFLNDDGTGNNDGRGEERVAWLRGAAVNGFRTRSSPLGDIVHSAPFYVGEPAAGHAGTSYANFRNSYRNREPMLYVGANDGMLHGFSAIDGREKLAYIPSMVYSRLSKLTHPNYGSTSATPSVPHQYLVDGSPMVADVEFNGVWKTVLAGGLNGGGQGYYALDVTDPSDFSEANAEALVLWEFSDRDDTDMGYSYNQPVLRYLNHQSAQWVKLQNGEWGLMVGNGYNSPAADGHASTTGHAVLFVLYVERGADGTWDRGDYIKIDTGVGSTSDPNGLSTPRPVDTDGDGVVDLAYAGDLQGNLWRFDLTDLSHPRAVKLYEARDLNGDPQPITTAPIVTRHPGGGLLVGFGTGKYLELTDIQDTSPQTFYAIWDQNPDSSSGLPITGVSDLVEQTINATATANGFNYRSVSANAVDYGDGKKGWFMRLPVAGERVAYNPIAREGRFIFTTLIPNTDECSAGGSSWLMEVDYLTGGRLDVSPFDVDHNGTFDMDDRIAFSYSGATGPEFAGGIQGEDGAIGILTTPTVIDKDENQEVKVLSSSTGRLSALRESKSGLHGRISWKEIIRP